MLKLSTTTLQQQQLYLLEHAYELEEEKYLPAIGNS